MFSSSPQPGITSRRIIHIDMDAFYASVEQRDQPALRGQPLAVGRVERRGVVVAASYEARAYGVRSAMPSIVARRKCSQLVFVPPRFPVYHVVSAQIHEIFRRYTAIIQPLSLDEAYLDVTEAASKYGSATAIAEAIREDIRRETGLAASAGVSYNRFLAKLASDCRKPDGLFVITPDQGPDFVARLPISQFHGIGPATARHMETLGIHTGNHLRQVSQDMLRAHFGKVANSYCNIARAIDDRPVDPHRVRKSIGSETTYAHDIHDLPAAEEAHRGCGESCLDGLYREKSPRAHRHTENQIFRLSKNDACDLPQGICQRKIHDVESCPAFIAIRSPFSHGDQAFGPYPFLLFQSGSHVQPANDVILTRKPPTALSRHHHRTLLGPGIRDAAIMSGLQDVFPLVKLGLMSS